MFDATFIFTDRVYRREGYVLTRVCPSIRLSVHIWEVSGQFQIGGYNSQVQLRGTCVWRVPHLGYPPVRPGRGYPARGVTPPRVTDGVLYTPRSVCLLPSLRRTFLLHIFITVRRTSAGSGKSSSPRRWDHENWVGSWTWREMSLKVK